MFNSLQICRSRFSACWNAGRTTQRCWTLPCMQFTGWDFSLSYLGQGRCGLCGKKGAQTDWVAIVVHWGTQLLSLSIFLYSSFLLFNRRKCVGVLARHVAAKLQTAFSSLIHINFLYSSKCQVYLLHLNTHQDTIFKGLSKQTD